MDPIKAWAGGLVKLLSASSGGSSLRNDTVGVPKKKKKSTIWVRARAYVKTQSRD